jgi:hypothetical protein
MKHDLNGIQPALVIDTAKQDLDAFGLLLGDQYRAHANLRQAIAEANERAGDHDFQFCADLGGEVFIQRGDDDGWPLDDQAAPVAAREIAIVCCLAHYSSQRKRGLPDVAAIRGGSG